MQSASQPYQTPARKAMTIMATTIAMMVICCCMALLTSLQ
jgi:hypothetical protein